MSAPEFGCDWASCSGPATARATTGCVREHITTGNVCRLHLARAEALHADDNLWCSECGPSGQRTRVRLRVDHLATAALAALTTTDPTANGAS